VLLLTPTLGHAFPLNSSTSSHRQITEAYTATSTGITQRTFKLSDSLNFKGTYYDPNPACLPIDTERVWVIVFAASGNLVLYQAADTGHYDGTLSDEFRGINLPLQRVGDVFLPGTYTYLYLASDCTRQFTTGLPYMNIFTVEP